MYEFKDEKVFWKGKCLKDVACEGFEILTPIIGRHNHVLFILGKPSKIDGQAFRLLSQGYARDADSVYLIMPTKIKPIKTADVDSFVALGKDHGYDKTSAYCQDKRMRLTKGKEPGDLRPLALNYATDGTTLFHGTARLAPPADSDLNASGLRFQPFSDRYEINMPPAKLTDGEKVWIRLGLSNHWSLCEGADFETLTPIIDHNGGYWSCSHARDTQRVWYLDQPIPEAQPDGVKMLGQGLLSDGSRMWLGARALDAVATDVAYVDAHVVKRERGVLLHHGDCIRFHGMDGTDQLIASGQPPSDDPDLGETLREIFTTVFAMFTKYAALHWRPSDVLTHLAENPFEPETLPAFTATLSDDGEITVSLENGPILRRPAAAWYTLACDLWDHQSTCAAGLRPYPSLGTMYPHASDLHQCLIRKHSQAFTRLMRWLWQDGVQDQAEYLAHFVLFLSAWRREWSQEELETLADLPSGLIRFLHYTQAHHRFEVTTNLAVSRLIIRDNWLEAADIRDRIDVLDTLHGAILDTNKVPYIFDEILPPLMARYTRENHAGVRELIGFTIDAALITGQVDCEVRQNFHHAKMLPVIRFCIAHDINVIFNRARLAEALWATDQVTEGNEVAAALITEIGEDAHLSGVYCNRLIYRAPRLWFLRGKCDIAWRKAPHKDAHLTRLKALESELSDLIERYGPACEDWEEIRDIRGDIARYREALE